MEECYFCNIMPANGKTRDGKKICLDCMIKLGFCEICGSIQKSGETSDTQLHFEEECFK